MRLERPMEGFHIDNLFEILEILHRYRILSVNYLYTKLSFDIEIAKKAIQFGRGIYLNIDEEDGIWIEDEGDFMVQGFDKKEN